MQWSKTLNLLSAGESDAGSIQRHIADSLSIVPHIPSGVERLTDLGSGQGFPAIPLAIVTGLPVDMVEADRRKAAFLTTALAQLGLNGHVWPSRIETVQLPPSPCITARALAPLERLLTLSKPLLAPAGCCLFLKGPGVPAEIADARRTHSFVAEIISTASQRSNLVKITGVQ